MDARGYTITTALAAVALATGCPRRAGGPGEAVRAPDGLAVAIYVAGTAGGGAPAAAAPRGKVRRALALVDDRRTVSIGADGRLRLADVAEGIELASLIVESLDPLDPLAVESCVREGGADRAAAANRKVRIVTVEGIEVEGWLRDATRLGDGAGQWVLEDEAGAVHFVTGELERYRIDDAVALEVRCVVRATPGQHRVRIAYATTDLSWAAAYRVDVASGGPDEGGAGADGAVSAAIQPTFTIAGSGLLGARRASVQLLVGLPGGDVSPRLAWSGDVELGADAVAVQPGARTIPASLQHVFRGGVATPDDNPRQSYWRTMSTFDVWVAISLDAAGAALVHDLPAGPALVAVSRDGVVRQGRVSWPAPDAEQPAGFDVWLWPDADVIGYRDRRQPRDDGMVLIEQHLYTISNHSRRAVTVWVEEELRPGAARRRVRKQWPVKGDRRGAWLRFAVRVPADGTERLGFESEYQW